MKDIGPQPAETALVDGNSQVDIETIVEQIWSDLGGTTSRSDIRRVLAEVTPAYEGARVKTYVPIFLRRDVIRRLQDELTHYQGTMAPEPENAASGKADDTVEEETSESATKYKGTELMPA